jgi:O-antigen/teichoic acid export membrane protein
LPLVREVTTFSLYLFVISIAAHIWFNLDSLVIGAALGTSAVAIYAVAFRLADYQRQLCSQFNDLLFPVVVRMGASDPREAMAAMLIDSTRVALSLVAIVSICVIGFGAPLIELWLGNGFDGAVLPLYVLALAGVAMVGLGPVGVFLLGTGRHRLVALCAVTEAVCNLVLSLLLVGPLGTFGVALGTAIPVTLVHVLILMPAACRDTSMPVTTFLRGVARAPLAGSVPAVGVWTLLTAWVPPASLWMMFIQSAAVGAVYAAAVWSVGLERTTRTRYAAHLREAARWTRTLPQWSGAA